WVFWFNVPFGIAAVFGLSRYLHEGVERRARHLDLQGAVMLFVAMAGLMVLLNQGSSLSQPVRLGFGAFTLVVALWLVRRLLTVAGAILPLDLWRDRLILLANLSAFVAGIVMIGVI